MTDNLLPHQLFGADFLVGKKAAILADDMGCGKTATVISALDKLNAKRVLILCPTVVKSNWYNEIRRWSKIDRQIDIVEGLPKQPLNDNGISILSHASIVVPSASSGTKQVKHTRRLAAQGLSYILQKQWDVVVVDEAHEFRKLEAKRTQALYGPDGVTSKTIYTWLLSGTIVVNSASDLYPMFYGPFKNLISSDIGWWQWCNRYCDLVPDGFDGVKPVGIKNHVELANVLKPVILRRTLSSVGIKLPTLDITPVLVAGEQDALIKIMADLESWSPKRLEIALQSQDEVRDSAIARVRHAVGLAKAPAIVSYIRNLLSVDKSPTVCFYQHTDVMRYMFDQLNEYRCGVIQGGMAPKKLKHMESSFQNKELDILFIQTQAGGMGLTLTVGKRVVVAEIPWTATYLMQAIKRVHRYTQKNPVTADLMLLSGCWLDDIILKVVQRKWRDEQTFLNLLTT